MTTPAPQSAPRTGLIGWVYGHVRALMWLLIAGVGVTGGLIYTGILGIDRLDEEVRQRVLTKFTEHYQGLVVTIDSAQILHGRGIQIRGLRIQDPHSDSQYAELLYIDEMLAACDTSLQELLTHEDVTFGYGGRAPRLTGPGLGVTVNEAALERRTLVKQEHVLG